MPYMLYTTNEFGSKVAKLLGSRGTRAHGSYNWVPGHGHYLFDFWKAFNSLPSWSKIAWFIVGIMVVATLIAILIKLGPKSAKKTDRVKSSRQPSTSNA